MHKSTVVAALVAVALALPVAAQQRGPSTAEERAQALQLARALEADPLHANARDARAWLTTWIVTVPDITVPVCGAFLGPVLESKKNHAPEIFIQGIFSSAAFAIEHPEQKADEHAMYLAGVEGSLRAYESIRKAKPKVTWPLLDDLIARRDRGELAQYVRETMPRCKK